jgi:hypothetical protein
MRKLNVRELVIFVIALTLGTALIGVAISLVMRLKHQPGPKGPVSIWLFDVRMMAIPA